MCHKSSNSNSADRGRLTPVSLSLASRWTSSFFLSDDDDIYCKTYRAETSVLDLYPKFSSKTVAWHDETNINATSIEDDSILKQLDAAAALDDDDDKAVIIGSRFCCCCCCKDCRLFLLLALPSHNDMIRCVLYYTKCKNELMSSSEPNVYPSTVLLLSLLGDWVPRAWWWW
jgi:hypothetical protein